ncbi:MAG: hypothetical protein LC720_00890 [Actinobacteria bacterium]|nr:hypothetical protein [Actinomycetota bacterium]
MTSQGSAYGRFRRALNRGNLDLVHAAALELPHVDLVDALRIVLLMRGADDERYDRAAARWLGRFALERPSARLEDLQLALHALEALPYNELAARQTLGRLCEAHGLHRVVAALGGDRGRSPAGD